MVRQVVIVPVFWGSAWRPGKGSISWTDVDADVRKVAKSYYLAGLAEHGLTSPAVVEPAVIVDADDDKIPTRFDQQAVWDFLDGLIDDKTLPAPSNWDQTTYRVYYGVAIAPGHANADPNVFGQNNKGYRGASAGYATANSDRAGVVTTFWHEVVEGAANAEIVDDCRTDTFDVDGVRVSRYLAEGRCWPFIDIGRPLSDPVGEPRIEGPYSGDYPVLGGMCGTQTLTYHVEYTDQRVVTTARAPGLDPSAFQWTIAGKPVPWRLPAVLHVSVDSEDPRLPKQPPRQRTATVRVEHAHDVLVFTTTGADGNFPLLLEVETLGVSAASDVVQIRGARCPELDEADSKCQKWIEDQTRKLDRDWKKWVDPSDPLIELVRTRPQSERERLLVLVAAARQLEIEHRPVAPEFAARLAVVLGVTPEVVLGKGVVTPVL